MPNPPSTTSLQPATPRRRGAQPGNLNSLKHGFYTSRFRRDELNSFDKTSPKGLTDEITMLRLLIRRQVDYTHQELSFDEYDTVMRTLCLACLTLNRLVRTQLLLRSSGNDDLSNAIDTALEQLAIEWHLGEPPARTLNPPQPKS